MLVWGCTITCRPEGILVRFLSPETEVQMQSTHNSIRKLAHLAGGQVSALCYMLRLESHQVVGSDEGLVERTQQM